MDNGKTDGLTWFKPVFLKSLKTVFFRCLEQIKSHTIYSLTLIGRTPMVRLPWLIRTRFCVNMKFFRWLKKQIFREIFLLYHEIVCFIYSLESHRRGYSNGYTQYTIIAQRIENAQNYHHLLPDLAPWLTLSGSNYSYLEQIFMVPKMFEPLKFDCNSRR